MMKTMRYSLLIAALAAGLSLGGCGKKEEAKKGPPPALISAAQAQSREVEVVEQSIGDADGSTVPTVAAEVAGRVLRIHAEVGASVKKGQLLAELDAADFSADAKRTEALAVTENRLTDRYRELAAKGFISPAGLESREAQTIVARELHARAAKNLARTRIVAPVAGRVEARFVSEGDWIDLGKPAFRLSTSDKLRIRLPFPETAADRIKAGQTVRLVSPSAPDKPFTGKVTEVRSLVGSANRSFDAIVEVANPGDWKPGASVTGKVVLEVHAGAVTVPEQSVVLRPAGKVVYVVKDGKAAQRVVKAGAKQEGYVEILDGLAAGETVAVDGAGFLTDGAAVNVQQPARNGAAK